MQTPKPDDETSSTTSKKNFRRGVALVGVVAIALGAWLALDDDDNSSESPSGEAEIVSVDELREAVSGPGTPVYWAGEQADTELELSRPEKGRTYVRYLTDGAEADDPKAAFLTVGTYVTTDPVARLTRLGEESGGVLAKAPGGATVYFARSQPRSIYLAYPGVEAQIEIYDPDFERALQLVNSGQIVPVG